MFAARKNIKLQVNFIIVELLNLKEFWPSGMNKLQAVLNNGPSLPGDSWSWDPPKEVGIV